MSKLPPATRTQLRRDDWIAAGQELLREHGIAGVKLKPLLDRLGVTTGSFYHHFRDVGDYLDALADDYGTDNLDRVIAAAADLPAAERLVKMWTLALEWEIPPLDRAMRVWALQSERAARSVRRLDEHLLQTIRAAFVDLGFDDHEARTRALLAFAAGAGRPFIFSPWPEDPADIELALRIVTTPLSDGR